MEEALRGNYSEFKGKRQGHAGNSTDPDGNQSEARESHFRQDVSTTTAFPYLTNIAE